MASYLHGVVLSLWFGFVYGQTPLCLPEFDWMTNDIGQSPCDVLEVLASCQTSVSVLPLTGPGNNTYAAPSPQDGEASPCLCNSVSYSITEACAYCQGYSILPWAQWNTDCPVVYGLPFPVPSGVDIPQWAYLDPPVAGSWDPVAAEEVADPTFTPGSVLATATVLPTTSTSTTPSVSVLTSLVTPTTTTAAPAATTSSAAKGSSNTWIIATVISVLIVVLIVLGIIIWWTCLRQQRTLENRVQELQAEVARALPGPNRVRVLGAAPDFS